MTKLSLLLLFIVGLVSANYFENVKRAELFEKIEGKMPDIHIHFSEEDYSRFLLTYQCLYDMDPLVKNDNEDCYTAPWANYTEIMQTLFSKKYINQSSLKPEELNKANSSDLDYTTFKSLVKAYSSKTVPEIFFLNESIVPIPEYETKKASLDFILDGETETKEKVKFSIGGKYTRIFEKQQFNLKIYNGDLFGRQQLRLRSEVVDPSFLRSKLAYDLTNVLGFPSVQASYTKLYINDDFYGLYLIRDIYKSQWIEQNFGEANTTSLYTCDASYGSSSYFNCVEDESEEVNAEWLDFIGKLESAKNEGELRRFFDVNLFMKWQALKYVLGSWDHITTQHNQYVYKQQNGKWMNLLYDFDSDFGAYKSPKPRQTFTEESLEQSLPLFKVLNINDNNNLLISYIKEIVFKQFNPIKLFPRIDELNKYLYDYIKEDRNILETTGRRPGHFVRPAVKIENNFTLEDHIKNSEFSNYELIKYIYLDTQYTRDEVYGLKRWILERYRFICEHYNMDCSIANEYLNAEYPSVEESKVTLEQNPGGCKNSGYMCCSDPNAYVVTTDSVGDWGIEGDLWCLINKDSTTTTKTTTTTSTSSPTQGAEKECWTLERGYPCCEHTKDVYYVSSNGGKWGVENGDWCGIMD